MKKLEKNINFNPLEVKWLNKSHFLLLPLLELSHNDLVEKGFINPFLNNWTNPTSLILLFDKKTSLEILKETFFKEGVKEGEYDDKFWTLEYPLNEEDIDTIVKPFIKGQYSKINRNYVFSKFPKQFRSINGTVTDSVNYQILTKCPKYKEKVEEYLGCYISPDLELYDAPLECQEVLGQKYVMTQKDLEILNKKQNVWMV